MKICFISHSSAKGGAERSLIELIDSLKTKGVDAFVIIPSYGLLVKEFKSRGIAFRIIPYRWWMSNKESPFLKRIAKIVLNFAMVIPVAITIMRHRCDIVCTNTITVCVGAFAAKILGRPHIWYIREFGYEDHGLVYDLGTRLSLWLMDHLSSICIANSNAVAKKYEQFIPKQKLRVVYQAVDVQYQGSFSSLISKEQADIKCLIVGALQEGKHQEEAIRAIGELASKGINARLYIVGDGNPKYKQFLRTLVTQNSLEKCVRFLGYVNNPFPLMRQADVVLMCSRAEAFGRVTIEAMKAGKPIIGARSGGTEELIRVGFNGLLYTPGNYKELAEKIIYLYRHPEIARQMGENGQKWSKQRFTEERYGNEVFAILKQLVSPNKQRKKE